MGIAIGLRYFYKDDNSCTYIGASFIHGTDGNPLTAIAEKVGATFAYYSSQMYYDGNGNALETETSSRLYQKVWEYFEAAIDCSRENFVDKDRSVQDFFSKRLEEDETLENEYMRDLLGSALQLLAGFVGSDLDQLSLKYFWTTDELPVDSCLEFNLISRELGRL